MNDFFVEKTEQLPDYAKFFGIKEHQRDLLKILVAVDKVCLENNIEYTIEGGTLLGAVRHKGFIPWDDDADISMTRENYEKFVKVIASNSDLEIVNHLWIPRIAFRNVEMTTYKFIDVFIYDKIPKNKIIAVIKRYFILFLQGIMHESYKPGGKVSFGYRALLMLLWLFGRLFTQKYKMKLYQKVSKIEGCSDSCEVTVYNDTYKRVAKDRNWFVANIFSQHIRVDFEEVTLMAVKKYDKSLRILFGDYMKLPPEEKRIPEHFYYKNKTV